MRPSETHLQEGLSVGPSKRIPVHYASLKIAAFGYFQPRRCFVSNKTHFSARHSHQLTDGWTLLLSIFHTISLSTELVEPWCHLANRLFLRPFAGVSDVSNRMRVWSRFYAANKSSSRDRLGFIHRAEDRAEGEKKTSFFLLFFCHRVRRLVFHRMTCSS